MFTIKKFTAEDANKLARKREGKMTFSEKLEYYWIKWKIHRRANKGFFYYEYGMWTSETLMKQLESEGFYCSLRASDVTTIIKW